MHTFSSGQGRNPNDPQRKHGRKDDANSRVVAGAPSVLEPSNEDRSQKTGSYRTNKKGQEAVSSDHKPHHHPGQDGMGKGVSYEGHVPQNHEAAQKRAGNAGHNGSKQGPLKIGLFQVIQEGPGGINDFHISVFCGIGPHLRNRDPRPKRL